MGRLPQRIERMPRELVENLRTLEHVDVRRRGDSLERLRERFPDWKAEIDRVGTDFSLLEHAVGTRARAIQLDLKPPTTSGGTTAGRLVGQGRRTRTHPANGQSREQSSRSGISEWELTTATAILSRFGGTIAVSEIGGGQSASHALLEAKKSNPEASASLDVAVNPYARAASDGRYGQPLFEAMKAEHAYANMERVRRQLFVESIGPSESGAPRRDKLVLANSAVTERNQGVVWIGARLGRVEGASAEYFLKVQLTQESVREQKETIGRMTLELGHRVVETGEGKDVESLRRHFEEALGNDGKLEMVAVKDAHGLQTRGAPDTSPLKIGRRAQQLRENVDTSAYANPVDQRIAWINKASGVRQIIDEVGEPLGLAQRISALPFSSIHGSAYYESAQIRARTIANEYDLDIGQLSGAPRGPTRLNLELERVLARRRLERMESPPELPRSYLVFTTHRGSGNDALAIDGLLVIRKTDGSLHETSFALTMPATETSGHEKALEKITEIQSRALAEVLSLPLADLN